MRSKYLKRSIFLFILLFIAASGVLAQQTFRYRAPLQGIAQAGFYKVALRPELVAKCRGDLADIRIVDHQKNFIPFVKLESLPSVKEDFITFPILRNDLQNDSVSSLVVENARSMLIRSLWIRLKNTAVSRTSDLSGSDDRQNWFAIKEDILLQQAYGDSGIGTYLQSLTFPASNYRYFRLNIYNQKKADLQILQAGVYGHTINEQTYSSLPGPRIIRKDSSDNITYIDLRFPLSFQVNKLGLSIAYPKYFKRKVHVYSVGEKSKTLLGETGISSEQAKQLVFSSKTARLQIQIINGDNPPLRIDSIQAFQLNQYLIAYLEAGKSYQLLVGDRLAKEPDYDLKFFADSVLSTVSEIRHGKLESNPVYRTLQGKKDKDFTLVLWVSIAAVLLLLIFMSWRMLGEIKSGNNPD